MGYVFISYSSQNRAVAEKFRNLFSKHQIDSWIAPDDIPAGSKYAQVINKAIKNCACFVLLLTKESIASQWVAKEVERAINYKRFIIPVKLEDVVLTDEFELYISTDQILSIPKIDENSEEVRRLIAALKAHVATSDYEKPMLEAEIISEGKMTDYISEHPYQPESDKNRKAAFWIAIASVILALVLVLGAALWYFSKQDDTPAGTQSTGTTESTLQSQTTDTTTTTTGTTTTTAGTTTTASTMSSAGTTTTAAPTTTTTAATTTAKPPVGENQLQSKHENAVESLKYGNPAFLMLKTVRVKVGEKATPQAAQIWPNVTIYSQNTAIAVGEGSCVKGVAKGETYIVVQGVTGSQEAYCVIVE